MFEWGVTPKAAQLLVGLGPDLLDDVFHFRVPAGIAPGSGENPGRIADNQRLETGVIALEDRSYQVRITLLHCLRLGRESSLICFSLLFLIHRRIRRSSKDPV